VSRIDPRLIELLKKKLGIEHAQVYRRIGKTSHDTFLPRRLAAIKLAAESGINISRFASADDLSTIRGASSASAQSAQVTTLLPSAAAKPSSRRRVKSAVKSAKPTRRGTSVWVVYGRNERLRKALFQFLRSIDLTPIEFSKAITLTGKASPHVSEILDAAFREAVAVVVLLTPDDEAKLKGEFIKATDPAYEKKLTGQARANVIFEAGMAFGRFPDQTVLVQIGNVRPFSDTAGRHVVHLTNSTESRQELINKLANAGCNVNAQGTDWHTDGDFDV
jgi:predicted nucleotide-binding protein